MEELLMNAIQGLLMLAITAGSTYLTLYLKKKLGVEKLQQIQKEYELISEVVRAGVEYAEQRFEAGEKLDAASKWIADRLKEKGLNIPAEEIEGLIESTVRKLKDQFGEDWANATQKIEKK